MKIELAYDINSIQSLTFREGVRQRVSMYLGTDDIEGAYQAIKEILNNSTDEALAGYGKQIDITLKNLELKHTQLPPIPFSPDEFL